MQSLTFGRIPDDLDIEEPYSLRLTQGDLTVAARAQPPTPREPFRPGPEGRP